MQVFVIHVRGQEERKAFIESQMRTLGFPYEYILEGNKEDLTSEILSANFADNGQPDTMYGTFARTSCTYKALQAYRRLLELNLDGALVFEDDIRLFPDFKRLFLKTLEEIKMLHAGEPILVNYEESSLMLVPRSERKNGKYVYSATRDRYAGCYYINRKAAQNIIGYVDEYRCDRPIDRFHTLLVEKGLIKYYWSYPCLALQCSADGSMPTMIPTKPRPMKRLKWMYKRAYKHLLYWLR